MFCNICLCLDNPAQSVGYGSQTGKSLKYETKEQKPLSNAQKCTCLLIVLENTVLSSAIIAG